MLTCVDTTKIGQPEISGRKLVYFLFFNFCWMLVLTKEYGYEEANRRYGRSKKVPELHVRGTKLSGKTKEGPFRSATESSD